MKKKIIAIFIVIFIILIAIGIIFFLNYKSRDKISIVLSKEEKMESRKVFSLEDYDIYYYGVEKVKIGGKDLIKTLEKDNTIVEKIIQQAKIDAQNGLCQKDAYLDGGSQIYIYNDFAIIKCNIETMSDKKIKDVYIGPNDMNINDVI